MPYTSTGSYDNHSPLLAADISPNLQLSDERKPHAVVAPWPGQGHINPLLHLSQKLVAQGFIVTFVNVEFAHQRVVSSIRRQEEKEKPTGSGDDHQLPLPSLPQPCPSEAITGYTSAKLAIRFVCIPDGVSRDDIRTSNVPELCKGTIRSAPAFEQLLRNLQPPPTCVISDTFLLHTQDAANKLGIPRVSFWTQSAASYAAHLAAALGLIELPSDPDEKRISRIPGVPPLQRKDLPSFLQCSDRSDFMFDFSVSPFLRTHEAACVLLNSFDAIEGKTIAALQEQQADCRFYPIGPVLPLEYFSRNKLSHSFTNKTAGFWAEDDGCLEWLDKQEEGSVLYVSLGSITELSGKDLEEFALGLEATGLPILWVLRPGALEGGEQAGLPAGLTERTEGQIVIVEWAPQLDVLAHEAIGGFLTHGGWNSTLEGVAQGKPMLGFPYFGDQMLNCRYIEEEWGNGLALERHGEGLLTRSVVESKARAVMEVEGKLRATALKLRDAARRTILNTDPGSSTATFQRLVRNLTNANQCSFS